MAIIETVIQFYSSAPTIDLELALSESLKDYDWSWFSQDPMGIAVYMEYDSQVVFNDITHRFREKKSKYTVLEQVIKTMTLCDLDP